MSASDLYPSLNPETFSESEKDVHVRNDSHEISLHHKLIMFQNAEASPHSRRLHCVGRHRRGYKSSPVRSPSAVSFPRRRRTSEVYRHSVRRPAEESERGEEASEWEWEQRYHLIYAPCPKVLTNQLSR